MKTFFKTLIFGFWAITTYAQQATELDPKFVKLPRYADLMAITTAIPTPIQGMQVYNIATASNWYYNGTAWTNTLGTVSAPLSLSQSAVVGTTIEGVHTNSGPPNAFGGIGVRGESIGGEYGAGVSGVGQNGNYGVQGLSNFIGVYGNGFVGGKFTGTNLALSTEGSLKFAGTGVGTIEAGNVLTTDGSGNATWQSIPNPTGPLYIGSSGASVMTFASTYSGTSASAGYFLNSNESCPHPTISSHNSGTGPAGYFIIENSASSYAALQSTTIGSGSGLRSTNNSNTNATAYLLNNNATGLALETSGGLKFGGTNVGTPALGKVLTATDANGNAIWRDVQIPIPYNMATNYSGTLFKLTTYGICGSFTSSHNNGVEGLSNNGSGGYFSSTSGYALITGTGNVGIGTSSPTAKLEVSGFSKLGDDATAPKIKMKKITGTGPAANGNKPIAHGIADASKILAVQIFMEYGASPSSTKTLPPNYTLIAGYEYQFEIDGANILISNKGGNSANIDSKNFRMTITYEQ